MVFARVFDTDGYIPLRESERGDVDIPTKTKFQTFLGRVGCSHANCLENLPLMAVVVLAYRVVVATTQITALSQAKG